MACRPLHFFLSPLTMLVAAGMSTGRLDALPDGRRRNSEQSACLPGYDPTCQDDPSYTNKFGASCSAHYPSVDCTGLGLLGFTEKEVAELVEACPCSCRIPCRTKAPTAPPSDFPTSAPISKAPTPLPSTSPTYRPSIAPSTSIISTKQPSAAPSLAALSWAGTTKISTSLPSTTQPSMDPPDLSPASLPLTVTNVEARQEEPQVDGGNSFVTSTSFLATLAIGGTLVTILAVFGLLSVRSKKKTARLSAEPKSSSGVRETKSDDSTNLDSNLQQIGNEDGVEVIDKTVTDLNILPGSSNEDKRSTNWIDPSLYLSSLVATIPIAEMNTIWDSTRLGEQAIETDERASSSTNMNKDKTNEFNESNQKLEEGLQERSRQGASMTIMSLHADSVASSVSSSSSSSSASSARPSLTGAIQVHDNENGMDGLSTFTESFFDRDSIGGLGTFSTIDDRPDSFAGIRPSMTGIIEKSATTEDDDQISTSSMSTTEVQARKLIKWAFRGYEVPVRPRLASHAEVDDENSVGHASALTMTDVD